jgi:hypothetical protein
MIATGFEGNSVLKRRLGLATEDLIQRRVSRRGGGSPLRPSSSARLTATLVVATLAALLLAARADAGVPEDTRAILSGLNTAVASGWLTEAEAREYRVIVRRCRWTVPDLPSARRAELAAVLHDVRLHAARYVRPRAHAVFAMLDTNTAYFASSGVPPPKTDVIGGDGILYRAFPGHGLQFHPLGNFGRLNGHVARGRILKTQQLSAALRARAVPRFSGWVWEYYFHFGGGRAPWTSGMAQAVGAQALARSARLLHQPPLLRTARNAFVTIPNRLLLRLPAGPWIRHYGFSTIVVLNAHLQTLLSLRKYVLISGDASAKSLNDELRRTATRLLWRFDVRGWSLYSLGGSPASLNYHMYVVDLLEELTRYYPANRVFARYAARFRSSLGTRARQIQLLDSVPFLDPSDDDLSTWAN